MNAEKLNKLAEEIEVQEQAEVFKAPTPLNIGAVIEARKAYYVERNSYIDKVENYASKLFDCLDDSLRMIAAEEWGAESRDVIAQGNFYIEEPDNKLGHISKDLWKGYALGFERGLLEGLMKYDAGFCDYDDDDINDDDLIVIDEDSLGCVGDILDNCYDVHVRIASHDDYVAYMKKYHPEEIEENEMTEKSREQKLRRAAKRKGLIARKGRDYSFQNLPGGWMIVDAATNSIIAGAFPYAFCLSLEEAEHYIYE